MWMLHITFTRALGKLNYWMALTCVSVSEWLRRVPRHKEMSNSQSHEGFVDLPLDAAAWLLHFKSQNQTLLKNGEVSL